MTIFDDNFWWQFLMTNFDDNFWWHFLMTIFDDLFSTCDFWYLRHWLQYWQLRTWFHDNLCYLTINCDTGQHSQFLRFFIGQIWSTSPLRGFLLVKFDQHLLWGVILIWRKGFSAWRYAKEIYRPGLTVLGGYFEMLESGKQGWFKVNLASWDKWDRLVAIKLNWVEKWFGPQSSTNVINLVIPRNLNIPTDYLFLVSTYGKTNSW